MALIDFRRHSQGFDDLIPLLSVSPVGKRWVARFLELRARGEAEIVPVADVALKGSKVSGKVCAGFVVAEGVRQIHFNFGEEVGLAAPLILHELIHCADEEFIASEPRNRELWNALEAGAAAILRQAARRSGKSVLDVSAAELSPGELGELRALKESFERHDHLRIFKAERLAYDGLFQWVNEARKAIEGYAGFLRELHRRRHVLDRMVSNQEIIRGYGLQAEYVLGFSWDAPAPRSLGPTRDQ